MCGRYRRTTREEELARIYRIPIPSQPDLPISYNIAPSQEMLAIRFNPESEQRSLDRLRWGLVPYWAKDEKIGFKTINARAETVDTAQSFPSASETGSASAQASAGLRTVRAQTSAAGYV
jgi:putative SOS response-associated peptidase YedK